MQYFKIDNLKAKLVQIETLLVQKKYFEASDNASALLKRATEVYNDKNISEPLFDLISQINEDMIYAYNFSNYDRSMFIRNIKGAVRKANKNNVTEFAPKSNTSKKK